MNQLRGFSAINKVAMFKVNRFTHTLAIAIALIMVGCPSSPIPATQSRPTSSTSSPSETLRQPPPPIASDQASEVESVQQAIIDDPVLNAEVQRLIADHSSTALQNQGMPTTVHPLQVIAIAVKNNYALAEWIAGVGDLPVEGHALLVRQLGRWIVVDHALGNTLLGASASTLSDLDVPAEDIPFLLDAFQYAGATLDAVDSQTNPAPIPCTTVTSDPNPPTNIRFTPEVESANLAGQLPTNGTTITVVYSLNGWLKIQTPIVGWIALNLTRVSCGNTLDEVGANLNRLVALQETGEDPLSAADTLIRFLRHADGAYAESAIAAFERLIQNATPYALVDALDRQSEDMRYSVLQMVQRNLSQSTQAQFEEYLTTQPNSPTLATWKTLNLD